MNKFLVIFLFIVSVSVADAQMIDYAHFDNHLFEKTLFNKLNEYRTQKNIDTLVWSNVIYKEIALRNISIIIAKDVLFHPDMRDVWDSLRVRQLIAAESDELFGIYAFPDNINRLSFSFFENIYRTSIVETTYEELAERAIQGWNKSPKHNATQYASFKVNGKPGVAACAVGVSGNNLYITFDFVSLVR